MTASMITDEYRDITPDYPYEIDKVYLDGRIRLKNSPRIYDGRCFEIQHKGRVIKLNEAYRQYQLSVVKKKLGIKEK